MVLEARGLVKVFPPPPFSGGAGLRALDGVDLAAGPGTLGLEGPNGSGKTTLLKTLAGVLEADGGTISAGGRPAASADLRKIAALCPPNPRSFYFRLSAAENLRFFGALAGLEPGRSLALARGLGARLGLPEAELERRFDRLSEGNMQKVSLIRAFSRPAEFLLLDEPFRGLDSAAVNGLLGLIEERGRLGAVLLSSHSPGLLREAAPRVVTLEKGRVRNGGAQ
ncbi:MAG: ABC transporter ATP-binding protein [Elusimicrobia bacterium]|nr:ABC transporter ATP-binding protein [Elusimicrobiota bacterium]